MHHGALTLTVAPAGDLNASSICSKTQDHRRHGHLRPIVPAGLAGKQGARDTFSARPSTQLVPAPRHTFRHLGPEDLRSLAVGRGDPRRVDAESGRSSPTMAEAAGDGAEINASRQ